MTTFFPDDFALYRLLSALLNRDIMVSSSSSLDSPKLHVTLPTGSILFCSISHLIFSANATRDSISWDSAITKNSSPPHLYAELFCVAIAFNVAAILFITMSSYIVTGKQIGRAHV